MLSQSKERALSEAHQLAQRQRLRDDAAADVPTHPVAAPPAGGTQAYETEKRLQLATETTLAAQQLEVLETSCRLWHWGELQLQLVRQRTVQPIPPAVLETAVRGLRGFMAARLRLAPPDELSLVLRVAVMEHCLVGHARLWQARKTQSRDARATTEVTFKDTLHPEEVRTIMATLVDRPSKELLDDATHPFRDTLQVAGFGFFFELFSRGVPWVDHYFLSHFNSTDHLAQQVFPPAPSGFRPPDVCHVAHVLGQWCVFSANHLTWVRSGEEAAAVWCLLFEHHLKAHAINKKFEFGQYHHFSQELHRFQTSKQQRAARRWVRRTHQSPDR